MNLDTVISEYGYLAILVGTFLEGVTILVLGAVAARFGYLELPWLMALTSLARSPEISAGFSWPTSWQSDTCPAQRVTQASSPWPDAAAVSPVRNMR